MCTCNNQLQPHDPMASCPISARVEQIERILQPRGRCTECGGGEGYWKHGPGDPLVGYHMFQPPAPERSVQ